VVQLLLLTIRIMNRIISLQRIGLNIFIRTTFDAKLNCNPKFTRPTFKLFNLKLKKGALYLNVQLELKIPQ